MNAAHLLAVVRRLIPVRGAAVTMPPAPVRVINITNEYDDHEVQPVDRTATIAWDDALARLPDGGTFWLSTTLDGRPHTRPVFAVVADGVVCTATSADAVKATGLRRSDPVSIATSCDGLDVVWTGRRPG